MRKKSEPTITPEQLIEWRGERARTVVARELKTPWRTYVGWERGESRIPGAVAAYIEKDNARR